MYWWRTVSFVPGMTLSWLKRIGVTQEARRIHVRKCVLYNEIAHALSVGAEITRM